VTIVVELLAMVALLCAAVVAVTTWHLPRSFTVAMVLGAAVRCSGVGLHCGAVADAEVAERCAVTACGWSPGGGGGVRCGVAGHWH
jgi:hypothetical protein